jgi:2-desacetyl-2-hydroxyethyl bacteriochlorophyllide A dehydrogenase
MDMRSLVWQGPNQLVVQDSPKPEPRPGEVLIKVAYTGICGSDITIYRGFHQRAKAPLIIGHEFVGHVAELGPGVDDRLQVGDMVTAEPTFSCGTCKYCRSNLSNLCAGVGVRGVDGPGAFAEYFTIKQEKVYKLPPDLPLREGAVIEPLAVGVHAVNKGKVAIDEDVAVVGAGPIGILTAQAARARGARRVFMIEIKPNRLKLAEKMGFIPIDGRNDPVEAVRSMSGGVDVVFDAAGALPSARYLVPLVKKGGRLVVVSIFKEEPPLDLRTMAYSELSLCGCFIYVPQDFHQAVELVASGKVDLASVISHEVPLEDAVRGFELMEKADDSMKVLIKIS